MKSQFRHALISQWQCTGNSAVRQNGSKAIASYTCYLNIQVNSGFQIYLYICITAKLLQYTLSHTLLSQPDFNCTNILSLANILHK